MDFRVRSDLACENYRDLKQPPKGVECTMEKLGRLTVSRLRIKDDEAAEELGKPCGSYVTVECGYFHLMGERDRALLVKLLTGEIRGMSERLCGHLPNAETNIFVAGLGNAEMTTDAIGPQTVRHLTATRHLREHERGLYRELGCASLSALAPGVLGQTGIETLELLRGAVAYVRPDLILVIDALAARSCERLASTVQISDVGIVPGSGVGNHRSAITRETMGVPVISLGVPTVVNSATLVWDALSEAGICEVGDSLQRVLKTGESFFVSPKECDVITKEASKILSEAISSAFIGGL